MVVSRITAKTSALPTTTHGSLALCVCRKRNISTLMGWGMWNNQTLRVRPPCAKHFSHTQSRTHRTHLQRDRTTAVRADAPFLLRGHDHRRQSASLDLNIFCESFLWTSRNFFRFLLWGLPAGEHQRAPGTSKCIIISQLSWMVLEGRGQGSMSGSQAGHCGSFVEARSE